MPTTVKASLKEQLRHLRSELAKVNLHLEDDDLLEAYKVAEQVQMSGFDLKSAIWKAIEEDPRYERRRPAAD